MPFTKEEHTGRARISACIGAALLDKIQEVLAVHPRSIGILNDQGESLLAKAHTSLGIAETANKSKNTARSQTRFDNLRNLVVPFIRDETVKYAIRQEDKQLFIALLMDSLDCNEPLLNGTSLLDYAKQQGDSNKSISWISNQLKSAEAMKALTTISLFSSQQRALEIQYLSDVSEIQQEGFQLIANELSNIDSKTQEPASFSI